MSWFGQKSQSEDTLVSRLIVSAAVLALMEREMKGRRDGETECPVSSLSAEEILLSRVVGTPKPAARGSAGRQRPPWQEASKGDCGKLHGIRAGV